MGESNGTLFSSHFERTQWGVVYFSVNKRSLFRHFTRKSEPACLDEEDAPLIDFHRYILTWPYAKEPKIDGLPGYDLSLFPFA